MGDNSFSVIESPSAMGDFSAEVRGSGLSLALVPTMGALHSGHLSLLRLASERADRVVVSIYVNPVQFGLSEDFDHYPRDLPSDLRYLELSGIAISGVYCPVSSDMYGGGFASRLDVPELSHHLCGKFRPDYFGGVAIIVAKLLHQVSADMAIFGEKDFQQLAVIRRMVIDLDFGVEILGAPTMRESDGLAISSRNVYLSSDERLQASLLYKVLSDCRVEILGGSDVVKTLAGGRQRLEAGGFHAVDYLTLVCESDLLEVTDYRGDTSMRLLVAAYLGKCRLIDNVSMQEGAYKD